MGFANRWRMFSAMALVALAFASANDCSFVRLDREKAFNRAPAQHQGALHICYAHVAAQLIDSKRDDSVQNATTYALDAALGAKIEAAPESSSPNWGTPCEAVRYLSGNGPCPEYAVADAFKNPTDLDKKLAFLTQYYSFYQETKATAGSLEIIGTSLQLYLSKELGLAESFVPSADELKALLKQNSPVRYLRGIVSYKCEKQKASSRAPASATECHEQKERGQKALRLIHDSLGEKKPVAATFCIESLTQLKPRSCNKHSALVIGRKQNGSRCELLIRNSWGKSCEKYASHLKCEEGDVWVDSQILAENISSLSYL